MSATTIPAKLYDLGDLIAVTLEVRDPKSTPTPNALVDPTTLVAKVKDPLGTVTTYTYGSSSNLTRSSLGKFDLEFVATMAGEWYYRFETTGIGQGAEEQKIVVRKSQFY